MMTEKFSQNFKVNLWLSNVIKDFMQSNSEMYLEWDLVPDELKQKINVLSHSLRDCMELSNKIMKELENSGE